MNKIEITYRNLEKVPNEIILGIYNHLYPFGDITSAIDLQEPYDARIFKETITPYTQERINEIKEQYAIEMKGSLQNYLQSCDGDVDDIHFAEKEFYTEYSDKCKRLDEIVEASINFYHALDKLYEQDIIQDFENGKPFQLTHDKSKADGYLIQKRFLVTKGCLIYINERNGQKSGCLYTEYDAKELLDNLIKEMYSENKIQLVENSEMPVENE